MAIDPGAIALPLVMPAVATSCLASVDSSNPKGSGEENTENGVSSNQGRTGSNTSHLEVVAQGPGNIEAGDADRRHDMQAREGSFREIIRSDFSGLVLSTSNQERMVCLALSLGALLLLVVTAEVFVLIQPETPWVLDRGYLIVCLADQAAMLGLLIIKHICHPRASMICTLLDFCHWVFVVVIFSGMILLRGRWSLLLLTAVFGVSLLVRFQMSNACIMTVVADRHTLPNISGHQVNMIFCIFFALGIIRFTIRVVWGDPCDHLTW